jgi:hypothetical protein
MHRMHRCERCEPKRAPGTLEARDARRPGIVIALCRQATSADVVFPGESA